MSDVTILIVEDNVQSRERLESLLIGFGYSNIKLAVDSAAAIENVTLYPIDLILMDIELDHSTLNGVELTKWVNDNYNIPVIYITGNTDLTTIQDVGTTRHQEFISKPYTPQQLHASIALTFIKHKSTEATDSNSAFKRGKYVFIKQSKKYQKIFIPDIIYLEADDKLLWIHTENVSISLTTSSLKEFHGRKYSNDILRIHNKYSVNINMVVSFEVSVHEITIMKNGKEKQLPVGRMYRKELYERLERY